MFRKLAAYCMLTCTTMVMGLLPLSIHICCDIQCCETIATAPCCADQQTERDHDDNCCQDQTFFNLAPVFAPVKTEISTHTFTESSTQEHAELFLHPPISTFGAPVVHDISLPEGLRRHLSLRVLII